MMWMDTGVTLILSLILPVVAQGARHTPPGKPKVTTCRSPEKETFTCWWEVGSDGGLPTTYSLYYHKANSKTLYECPDYKTAGNNTCFFNKNYTSVWVTYNITVVATNALGSNTSDPFDVDVEYIVMPHPPENLTVAVLEDKDGPFLRVMWETPRKADTRSGWITLIYEIRVKLEDAQEWEEHRAGLQKMFNVFSLHSGGFYMVQVRCKPDHGFWSEWSTTSYVKVPDYIHRNRSVWILVAIFSAFIFLILTWIINKNGNSLKKYLLPPVPGPRIKGFDKQLLKNGKSEVVFNGLVVNSFPSRSTDNEDLLVEYLEVYTSEEQVQTLEGKDLQGIGCLKSKSPSDSDSGRGSCDSHTLLLEKCGGMESKEESSYEEPELQQAQVDIPDTSNGQVKTVPLIFSSLIHGSSNNQHHHSPERPQEHQVPDNLIPNIPYHPNPDYMDGPGKCNQYHLKQSPSAGAVHLQNTSDFVIPCLEGQSESMGLGMPHCRSMEYVEVQKVNQENQLVLKPLSSHSLGPFQVPLVDAGEDYSKVNGVNKDNVLLLQRQRELAETIQYGDHQVKEGALEQSYPKQQQGKEDTNRPVATQLQESMCPTTSGYVDNASMLTF